MKLNKKGFTLVELLAVIILLGVISGVGFAGTTIYITRTREKSYEAMVTTLYESTRQYIIDKGILVPNCKNEDITTCGGDDALLITSDKLIKLGYIKELRDPVSKSNKNEQCTGTVKVTRKKSTKVSKLDEYNYRVHLECSQSVEDKDFNDTKRMEK